MHEASIAQSIIDEIEDLMSKGRITGRVRRICLRVGRMTAVVHDNLSFMFAALAEGTGLEGARLKIEGVPIRCLCQSCGARFEIEEPCFLCERCSSPEVEILSGRELMIEAVEVE